MGIFQELSQQLTALFESSAPQVRRWPKIGRLPGFDSAEKSREAFTRLAFSILGCVASADGQLPQRHHSDYQRYIHRVLGTQRQDELIALETMFRAGRAQHDFAQLLKDFTVMVSSQRKFHEAIAEGMIFVAELPGEKRPEADKLVREALAAFGLTVIEPAKPAARQPVATPQASSSESGSNRQVSDELKSRVQKSIGKEDPYLILGCNRLDSPEKIKARYREVVATVHPDRLRASGVSEDKIREVREQFTRIVKAYNQIRRERNFE